MEHILYLLSTKQYYYIIIYKLTNFLLFNFAVAYGNQRVIEALSSSICAP